jgi:hypothetical protein
VRHRHLNNTEWTRAAIDSLLERGDLPDWRELFARVRGDKALAREVLAVATLHEVEGASPMAIHLVLTLWPELNGAHSTP